MSKTVLDSYELLLKKYNYSPVILLETAIKDFFPHMKLSTAKKRAAIQDLPFPVFKAEDSQKAPYMVKISFLAKHLDNLNEVASRDWESMKL